MVHEKETAANGKAALQNNVRPKYPHFHSAALSSGKAHDPRGYSGVSKQATVERVHTADIR